MDIRMGGCVWKLNACLCHFEITEEIRDGDTNDMLFMCNDIDVNGEEFVVDGSEQDVE